MLNTQDRPASELFSELNRLQGVLDQVFRPSGRSHIRALGGASFPTLNVGATDGAIEVMALAPGLDPASVQVTVDRGLLVIAGERQGDVPDDEGTSVYAQERFAGPFRRVVSLPDDADPQRVEASYRDGVLRVSIAKRESSKPRRIEIN